MEKGSNKLKALPLFYFTVIFSVMGMLLQTIAVLFGYDAVKHVYKLGSGIGKTTGVILFLMTIAYFVISIYLMNGKKLHPVKSKGLFGFLTTLLLGCVIVISSLVVCIESLKLGGTVATVSVLLCVSSVFAGLYFLFVPFESKDKTLLNFLGFFPVIWSALSLMRIYFDVATAINDPIKTLFQVSMVVVMLSFLAELRLRANRKCGGIAVAITGTAVFLSCSSVISMMILYVIPKSVTTGEMLLSLCQLLISFYLLNKLYFSVSK